jgi:hypothetical protein
MNWQWLIDQGLIQGSASHYTDGTSLQAGEYSHAIKTAYAAANDTQRRQLVDMLYSTGLYGGQKEYWYTKRSGQDLSDLGNASTGLKTYDYSGTSGTPVEPGTGTPGWIDPTVNGRTPTSEEEEVREQERLQKEKAAAEAEAAEAAGGGGTAEDETGPTSPGGGSGGPVEDGSANDSGGLSRSDLQLIYRWMPSGALNVFIDAYLERGSAVAWAAVRNDSQYETWFPGNMDQYGNIRYAENQYAGIREGYRDVLRSAGLEPNNIGAMEGKMIALMEGEVSPQEFQSRVDGVYNRIISASDQIKQYYADQHGISGLETEDLLFAAMDSDFGRLTLEQGYRIAEVGGAAKESGFSINANLADLISDRGVNLPAARETFGRAQYLVPVLDVLAQRHFDPDDDFDLGEFLQSEVFNDPGQNLRMRRLLQRERSSFGRTGSFTTDGSRVTGLLEG